MADNLKVNSEQERNRRYNQAEGTTIHTPARSVVKVEVDKSQPPKPINFDVTNKNIFNLLMCSIENFFKIRHSKY